MQILFPASYSETAAWLRKAAISNEGTLRQCISQLQAALGADAHLQTLTAGVQVRPGPTGGPPGRRWSSWSYPLSLLSLHFHPFSSCMWHSMQ
jgi:hypothetical protein